MAIKTKKKAVKAKAKKKVAAKKPAKVVKPLKPVGVVTHFFTAIKVAIVKFKVPVKIGATVIFRGATTDFKQKITSLQFDHKPLKVAIKNKEIGIKVSKRVREDDEVFLGE
jgi:hypothetical protein